MSPRAAWRLERMGFGPVFDYVGGKMDWLDHGLPHEGSAVLAGGVLEVAPTCHVEERVSDVVRRLDNLPGPCVAVNEHGIVLGVVTAEMLAPDAEARVEEVARFGVSTVRPSEDLEALLRRMTKAGIEEILVTTPEGELMGVLRRATAEGALAGMDR